MFLKSPKEHFYSHTTSFEILLLFCSPADTQNPVGGLNLACFIHVCPTRFFELLIDPNNFILFFNSVDNELLADLDLKNIVQHVTLESLTAVYRLTTVDMIPRQKF